MYQGTYARNPRKPRKRAVRMNKTAILLLAVILLAGAVIGTTVAYLTTNTGSIVNTFEYAKVTCEVKEDFTGNSKQNVKIQNTGNVDAYIRATYVVNWLDRAGKIVPASSVPEDLYIVKITETSTDWQKGSDGYYYYMKPVAPGDLTAGSLIGYEVIYPANPEYTLQVEIIASAIQSQPASAVQQAWGVTYPLSSSN